MKTIHTEIEIDASPECVWRILTDFPSFPQWNPFIRQISGEPKIGAPLQMKSRFFGSRHMNFRSIVVRLEPNRELRWLGHFLFPGLFDGEHGFILEPVEPDRTRLIHDETFTGLLVPLFSSWLDKHTRQGFERMNLALKARAEQEPTCSPQPAKLVAQTCGLANDPSPGSKDNTQ